MNPASDIASTPAVKALQVERGSRASYAKMEERGGFRTAISNDLAEFLGEVDTAYLATVNSAGQPYAQHRGGPKGFIRIIGAQTLAFADYTGNRQYITTGNLAESDRAFIGQRVRVRFNLGFEPIGFQAYRSFRQVFLRLFDV